MSWRGARDHKAVKFTGNSNKGCCLPSRRQTYISDASSDPSSDPHIHSKKSSLLLQKVQVAAFTKRAFLKIKKMRMKFLPCKVDVHHY